MPVSSTDLLLLQGHGYEVFVLEHNPFDKRILLSAGHDGQIMIWDIVSGARIKTFYNAVRIFVSVSLSFIMLTP